MTDISRKPRYVLHVFNKGSDSESSEDESRTNYGSALYSYNPPPLPALSRSPPPPPSPLTTNIPTRTPRTQASHQSLSSPSSASSPAAEEPTPSTDESGFADRSHRTDIPPITTTRGVTGKLFHGLKSPFHHKSPHPRPQPPTPSSSLPTTVRVPSPSIKPFDPLHSSHRQSRLPIPTPPLPVQLHLRPSQSVSLFLPPPTLTGMSTLTLVERRLPNTYGSVFLQR